MPTIGAGASYAGITPAGSGYITPAVAKSGVIFQSPFALRSLAGRYIDPRLRQYVYLANGRAQGQAEVPQLVYLALVTAKNSSTISGFGNEFFNMLEIGDDFQNKVEGFVNNAVQSLVTAGLMSLNSVTTTRFGSSGLLLNVQWTDLTTLIQHTTSI